MKALIIYDDVTRAANTNAILHRVAHRADMAVNWDIRPWRLNMLKLPATAGLALRDAVDAQLIVFAVRRINKLHVWLMNWLEQWATLRQTADAALALVGDGTAEAFTAPATVAMSRFARQNGLSFFFNNHGEINNKPEIPDPSPNDEISYVMAPRLQSGQRQKVSPILAGASMIEASDMINQPHLATAFGAPGIGPR